VPGDGAAGSEGSAGCEAWVVERPEANVTLGVEEGDRSGSQVVSDPRGGGDLVHCHGLSRFLSLFNG
jgi:hypothetical protein